MYGYGFLLVQVKKYVSYRSVIKYLSPDILFFILKISSYIVCGWRYKLVSPTSSFPFHSNKDDNTWALVEEEVRNGKFSSLEELEKESENWK